MNKYKITIIVPLKDRDYYVKIWFKKNIISEFYYIFADGSITNENQIFFDSINLSNVKYIRYKPDTSAHLYLSKMHDAISQIKTEYVMTADDDDFLNYKGIIKCINFLDINKNYICASGMICKVWNNFDINKKNNFKNIKYKIYPEFLNELINLNDKVNLDGLITYLDNSIDTNYLWYAVYRKDKFENIWYDLRNSKIEDTDFIEILQTCLSFYSISKSVFCLSAYYDKNHIAFVPANSHADSFH